MRNSRKGRFRVWDRAQDAFNGEDLVYNFDAIDELIGGKTGTSGSSGAQYLGIADTWLGVGDVVPAESQTRYPGTSNGGYENQIGRRTLYSVVSGLNFNDVPLGTVIMWWRPVPDITVPDGWAICDGRTIAAADHSFPTSESIILPDLRNKMVVGADDRVPGIRATGRYRHDTGATPAQDKNNMWRGTREPDGTAGAPGVGYDTALEEATLSGSNEERGLDHEHGRGTLEIKDHTHGAGHFHTVPSHAHRLADHTHPHPHVHLVPNHYHDFNTTETFFTGQARVSATDGSEGKITFGSGLQSLVSPASKDHVHRIDMNRAGATGERKISDGAANLGFFTGYWSAIWGYNTDPRNASSSAGYQAQAVSSKPTLFQQNSTYLNAHEPYFSTDGTTLRISEGSGELKTNSMTTTEEKTQGIASDASSRALNGVTGRHAGKMKVRPQYVGMLFLMKVRVSTNII